MSTVKKTSSTMRRRLPGGLRPELRLRRMRAHPALRDLLTETRLSPQDFVMPVFVKAGTSICHPIASMPGQCQYSVDQLSVILQEIKTAGVSAVILFGLPASKDAMGLSALDTHGVVQQAVRYIKQQAPHILVIADLCCCEYTNHGHCGVLHHDPGHTCVVDNDRTLVLLGEQAVSLAQAGCDVVAPSGMMDGVVQVVRHYLDHAGFSAIPILNYSVKYASGFYGPFRDAADGAPKFGDRSSYQMNPANAKEALREVEQDLTEGVDMIMVKPAGHYLDIIRRVKHDNPEVPLAAYQVSGEYAMIKAAAEKGWVDETAVMMESLIAIKRAGADFIISYFALQAATVLNVRAMHD